MSRKKYKIAEKIIEKENFYFTWNIWCVCFVNVYNYTEKTKNLYILGNLIFLNSVECFSRKEKQRINLVES